VKITEQEGAEKPGAKRGTLGVYQTSWSGSGNRTQAYLMAPGRGKVTCNGLLQIGS
jgi:hypothetical protein